MALLGGLIGDSPGLVAVRTQVEQLLRRQSGSRRLPPVLILGETGTGKGLLASGIHEAGSRAAGPFVAVNCAAIPETLLEAELFGFEQGAFTDARHAKAGLFQTANRGTLFLDEIGLLPENLQAKLLTVLEDRTVRRLGSTRSEPVDVWIISATSEDLKAGARRRGFREELYHRLAVVTLQLPALRERGQDILTLAEHFLARTCTDYELAPKTLAEDARAALLAYRWPGNVRELANLMERATLLGDASRVTAETMELGAPGARPASRPPDDDASPARAPQATSLEQAVGEVEQGRILEALRETRWNISHAADRLGVTRNTLRYRLKKYGLQAPSGTAEPTTTFEPVSLTVEPAPAPRAAHVQWERRHVALLRADLVSASSVGPSADAGAVLETLVEKIHTFGGQVEDVSPRGLMALFGQEPVEDAPRRAAHAALAMQKIVTHDRGSSAELPGVRVGLHVGEVLVARVSSTTRLDHEAKREAWAQLEAFIGSAEPGTVLVSEPTRPFLERRFVLTPCAASDGTVGRVYQLVGLERTGLGLGEQLTPFVGRGRELEQFAQAFEQAEAGHGQVVAVVGEAGVGKSRLFWEFIESPRHRDSLILLSSAVSYGKAMPYLPVIDLLKTYFKIEPRDDADRVRERIREKVLSLERGLAPALSALLALLDIPIDDEQWRTVDPSQKRQRTLEAVKLLLLEESRFRPVIVIFEDLHWIDSETQAVLDTLVESLPSHRILLLVSYRPEYQHTWGSKSSYAQLRLDPLSPENAHALLDSRVGRDEATAALKAVLIERTGGNPFFLEESVRTLVETGVLVGDRGAYRLARSAGEVRVPSTVQAVLAARIDRLSPEDKTLLQTAAVIGKDVLFALLRAVADLPQESLSASLVRLRGSEFLYETRHVPELEYVFKHALSHEVAYGGLLPERRRALHARIVDAIETLHRDRLGEQTERLAHHALRGEQWEKAVRYGRQAGVKCLERSANREAARYFEQALSALAGLPEARSTSELAVDLRLDLYYAMQPLNDLPRLLEHVREAEALARALGDKSRLGWALLHVCHLLVLTGECAEGVGIGHRALALGQSTGDRALQVVALLWVGCGCYALGEHRRAVELLRQSLTVLEEAPQGDRGVASRFLGIRIPVVARAYLSMFLSELGEFGAADTAGRDALRIAESVDHPFPRALACWMVGAGLSPKGEFDRAVPLFERGIAVAAKWGYERTVGHNCYLLGYALVLAGRTGEGLSLLQRGVGQLDDNTGYTWLRGRRLSMVGEGYLSAGQIDEARAVAEEALTFSHKRREGGFEAWALRLLAEIAARSDPPDADMAERQYRTALALASQLEMRPLIAHCHLGLGKLYGLVGKRQEAREHLATAAAMYREMDMRFWLEQAEAK